ncbi:MFS transporter [Rhodococcus sp. 14-2483-1-2]|uniref:MFS transporter n=1 Tax=Rhodococcus sp. 14-2483-1-2 TaxID=2023147 RepID=UPI000B9B122B|nr:MFS transporter [Rhodococcus sp. 14-2483-1-2]OZF37494.1 MFS transporter [Rhodococcus sp. 14-2483-1-2]
MATRRALWVASVAQLVVVLDVSVLNVALPSMQHDLGLGTAMTSWVATGYSVAFAGALLAAARLADGLGAARVVLWSTVAFTGASILGGLAVTGWMLIGARIGQGLAAAALSPATFTLLTVTYREGPDRTRAIALWTAVSVAGGGIGNIVSGALTEFVSWRSVLLINVPIGVLVVVAARALISGRPTPVAEVRWSSVAASVLAFGSAVYALSLFAERGRISGPVLVASALSVALALAWVRRDRASAVPLIPPSLWRRPEIAFGTAATAFTAVCFQVSIWYFLTFRFQQNWGYSPLQTGLAFLPLTVTLMVVNLAVVPRLLDRISARVLISVGALIAASGVWWIGWSSTEQFWIAVLGPSLVVGIGGGLLNTPLATIVTSGVAQEEAGAASGLMNTAKQFGGAVGLSAATAATTVSGNERAPYLVMVLALVVAAALAMRLEDSRAKGSGSSAVD